MVFDRKELSAKLFKTFFFYDKREVSALFVAGVDTVGFLTTKIQQTIFADSMRASVVMVYETAVGYKGKFIEILVAMQWRRNGGVKIGTVCAWDASLIMKIVCSYFFVKVFHVAPPVKIL